jgi:hypothetical protein
MVSVMFTYELCLIFCALCRACDHTHTLSTVGDHTHTFTTNNTGGGQSHENMQPTAFVGHVFIFVGYKDDGHIWSSINTLIK